MSETRSMLAEAASRLFGDHRTREVSANAERGIWPRMLWEQCERAGLTGAACSEARGGAGLGIADLATLIRIAGAHAVPLPLVETLLAEQMLAAAGLPPRPGPLTVGPVLAADRPILTQRDSQWVLDGTLHRIPWGRDAAAVVVVAECGGRPTTVVIDAPAIEREGRNYAFEPRDDLRFDGLVVPASNVGRPGGGSNRDVLHLRGALYRALLTTGALERILELTVNYAQERVAFGRPIGKFQAVQQQIAVLATEVAAAAGATAAAVDAGDNDEASLVIGAAKARVGEAAGKAAAIAHQVHAAIGFTHEHSLHLFTRRLWSWRDEFGSESEWCAWVGRAVARVGGERLWAHVTNAARRDAPGRQA